MDKVKSNIKVFSFDLWRTLIESNPAFDSHREELFLKALVKDKPSISKNEFADVFRRVKHHMERISEERGEHVDWRERILTLCDYLHIDRPSGTDLYKLKTQQDSLVASYPPTLIHPLIPNLFKKIVKDGRCIAVISNTGLIDSDVAKNILTKYGLSSYITYYVFSDKSGLTKPNKLVYRNLAAQAACAPIEILHIGDSQVADYTGALNAGLQAIHSPLDRECIKEVEKILLAKEH